MVGTAKIQPASELAGNHRERDDDYREVVAQLNAEWRVIVCRDGIQWILQRRDGVRAGRARWAGVHYDTRRETISRLSRATGAEIGPAAWAALLALPEHIGGGWDG